MRNDSFGYPNLLLGCSTDLFQYADVPGAVNGVRFLFYVWPIAAFVTMFFTIS